MSEHDSTSRLIRNPEQPAVAIESPTPDNFTIDGYRDMFGEVFDEHLHIFFTNYITRKRRVAQAIPIYSGANSLGIYGGYILGYSLQGLAGKLATFTDVTSGTNMPVLSIGFDARGTANDTFAVPLHIGGQLVASLNDPSIQGVLFVESTISD